MNKQTLEEFIKIELEGYDEIDFSTYERFIELGAKWQQERMYSEEEVEKQKLEFAIEQLNKLEFDPKENILDFVLHIKNKIKELEKKLKQL